MTVLLSVPVGIYAPFLKPAWLTPLLGFFSVRCLFVFTAGKVTSSFQLQRPLPGSDPELVNVILLGPPFSNFPAFPICSDRLTKRFFVVTGSFLEKIFCLFWEDFSLQEGSCFGPPLTRDLVLDQIATAAFDLRHFANLSLAAFLQIGDNLKP